MKGRLAVPRYYCDDCGLVVYCERPNGMPRLPEDTLKAFKRLHGGCEGEPRYMCGIGTYSPPRGQETQS